MRKRLHAPQEVSGLVALSTRVPAPLKRRLLVHCAERGIAMQRFVEEAVHERLVAEKKQQRGLRRWLNRTAKPVTRLREYFA